jgi:hypothetical protein
MPLRPDLIPETILKAARRAHLNTPHWYVGRTNGHEGHARQTSLESIIEQVDQGNPKEPEASPKSSSRD